MSVITRKESERSSVSRLPGSRDLQIALNVLNYYATQYGDSNLFDANSLGKTLCALQEELKNVSRGEVPDVKNIQEPSWLDRVLKTHRFKSWFEANCTLGTGFSSVSGMGWRIAHPPFDPQVDYIENEHGKPSLIRFSQVFGFNKDDEKGEKWRSAGISISPYRDLAGRARLVANILSGNERTKTGGIIESWLLRDGVSDGVDGRVVLHRNPDSKLHNNSYDRYSITQNHQMYQVTGYCRIVRDVMA